MNKTSEITMKTYEIPSDIQKEIDGLTQDISAFRKGEINPVKFKGIRVGQGVYEQRIDDTYMFRIRCAGGVITPSQIKRVAELSEQYGADHFHVTTRQDVQLHYLKLEDTPIAYAGLIESGLSPRGGGGNTVRNIMASVDSGWAKDEEFDVLPYAQALTARMIAEEDSWNLPRKFKTAFSNAYSDNCEATITCLGFIATHKDGEAGFQVYVGGGMGAKPMPGKLIWEFIKADEVYSLTKAIKLMFDVNGNRRKRFQAKIKFLVDKLGVEEFRTKVEAEWEKVKATNPAPLDISEYTYEYKSEENISVEPVEVNSEEFNIWKKRYVTAQKQSGLFSIKVPLKLGDIYNNDGVALAELIAPFGDNTFRLNFNQNVHIINIPEVYLGYLFQGLMKFHTESQQPELVSNMIACTGAATCRLGLCLPRGVLPETADRLLASGIDIDSIPDFKIHVSGCPNTCGRHWSADLGMFGRVGRKEKVSYPAYNVVAGAEIGDGKSDFAYKICEVAAKFAPDFLTKVVALWLTKNDQFENFASWLQEGGKEEIAEIAKSYAEMVPTIQENEDFYTDWGAKNQFSILHGQQAECSAGVFDMIDVDADAIRLFVKRIPELEDAAQKEADLNSLVITAARMLLVTRDIEPKNDEHALLMFKTHFIDTHIVSEDYTALIDLAVESKSSEIAKEEEKVLALGQALLDLYKPMDDSLRFPSLK